jgi:NAD(P)-dependent dehydrogenase (short-subunit alcohol dehydrogenase family)
MCVVDVVLLMLSKSSAVVGFTRSYSALLIHERITLNAVCPNIVRTNISTTEFYDTVDRRELFTPMESMIQIFESLLGKDARTGYIFECGPRDIMLRTAPDYMDEATQEACDLIRERSVVMHRNSLHVDDDI